MKQVSITLIALAMSFGQFHASARTDLLRETFQNVNGDPENLVTLDESQLDNPTGWTFTDAYAGPGYVVIKKGGTVTTPPVAGVSGNAAFYFEVRPWEDPTGKNPVDWENIKPHALSITNGELSTYEFDGMTTMGSYCIYDITPETRITLTASYDMMLSGVGIYYGDNENGSMVTSDFTKFSHESGDYYSPFDLVLTPTTGSLCYDDGKHNILVYTLDGSAPVRTSTRYDGTPIHIAATTTVRTATIFGDGTMYTDTQRVYNFPQPKTPEIPAATYNVTVTRPGSLKSELLDLDADEINGLVLKGKINGEDLKYLASSEGRTAKITYLDLEDVTFEYDGSVYRTEVYVPVGMGTVTTYNYYLSETNYTEHRSTSPTSQVYDCYSNNLASAFTGESNVKRVVVPKVLTSIGSGAFSSVTMATLPEGIEEIGAFAFSSCSNVNLPVSIKKIGAYAFGENLIKPEIDLPNLEYLDDGAFKGAKIVKFNFNDKLKHLGKEAFAGTMIEEAVFTSPVDTIPESLFSGCKFLTKVDITGNVKVIGWRAFYMSNNIESFSIPQTVESVGVDAIPDYLLPAPENGIVYIGKAAYKRTENLTECAIKEGTVSITDGLFRGSDLAKITLPASLKTIGNGVFAWTKLTSTPDMPGVTRIEDDAFEYCPELGRVTIPEQVEYVGYAFRGCDALWSLTYNAIDAECPYGVSPRDLERIVIGDKVRRLPRGIYTNNTNVTEVILPASVEILEPMVFAGCSNLEYVRLSDNITTISELAFERCYALSDIHWPAKLTTVGRSAFDHCTSLTTISLPEGTEKVDSYAFGYCSNVTTLYIASTITELVQGAFTFDNRDRSTVITATATEPQDYEWEWYYIGNPTVKVPAASIERYKSHPKWAYCENIIPIEEISAPVETSSTSFDSGIDEDTDLSDTVIGDVYVTVGEEDGYDPTDGSITLNSTMDEEYIDAIGDMAPGQSDLANRFNGLVVMVNAGTGTITINCLTLGENRLNVKIGTAEPEVYTRDSKGDITVDYSVTEPTYVYIYGTSASATPARVRAKAPAQSGNCIKIYSVGVDPTTVGIDGVGEDKVNESEIIGIYNLNGAKVSNPATPGIYIVRRADGTTAKIAIK